MNWQLWSSPSKHFVSGCEPRLFEATFEQKRLVVELLIDRVVVTNGEVEIRYVIPTSQQ